MIPILHQKAKTIRRNLSKFFEKEMISHQKGYRSKHKIVFPLVEIAKGKETIEAGEVYHDAGYCLIWKISLFTGMDLNQGQWKITLNLEKITGFILHSWKVHLSGHSIKPSCHYYFIRNAEITSI